MKKKIALTLLGTILIYASVAFAIKAGLGVMPVDAAINTVADVLNVKVGTFSMLFHGTFFLVQMIMEGKNFRKIQFLQILYITLGGTVLNFFLYTVLKNLTFSFYPIRLIVTLAAFFISAFGVTLVLETQLIRIPMDGCVQMVADRIGTTMGKLRQKIDFALVVICVLLTVVFKTQWTLREGTIIAALMFGPSMDLWKKKFFTK